MAPLGRPAERTKKSAFVEATVFPAPAIQHLFRGFSTGILNYSNLVKGHGAPR
jgi:hypothetical protein